MGYFSLFQGNQDDYLCPKMCPNDCRNLAGLGPDYDKNCWDREHCQIGKNNTTSIF